MSEEPKTDSKTFKRLEKIGKLIAHRNELSFARVAAYSVSYSYSNPFGDGLLNYEPSFENQLVLKEMFIAEINDAIKHIDAQLAECGIVI